jgi:NAD(P)-dependent dehydrogenase (short-subunit alcohol dehydrogenase family)
MDDKIVLITGATSGIGKATALELAEKGATVVIFARNKIKGENTIKEIADKSGNKKLDLLIGDLSSLESVRMASEEFRKKYQRLDVLVNNAGIFINYRKTTSEGFEYTFGVNHLSHFLLTSLLLDILKSSAPSRIINLSSEAQHNAQIDFNDLMSEEKFSGFKAYGQSKLANILFTYELSRRLEGTGVTVNAVHPGVVNTHFGSDSKGVIKVMLALFKPFLRSPRKGAETSVYLCKSPEVEGVTGKYFADCHEIRSNEESYDPEIARRLWEISVKLVN